MLKKKNHKTVVSIYFHYYRPSYGEIEILNTKIEI